MLKKFISHLNWDSDTVPSNSLIYSLFPFALIPMTFTAVLKVAFVMAAIAVLDAR